MWVFYTCAMLPLVLGAVLWYYEKSVTWWEWLAAFAVALTTALIFQWISVMGMTADTETWSGFITHGRHYAAWQEYYEYAVYRTETRTGTRTVSDGKRSRTETYTYTVQVFDHWQPTSTWHSDNYSINSNIDTSYSIDRGGWYGLAKDFGGFTSTRGTRTTVSHNSRMIGGDPNDYLTQNTTGYIKPCTKNVSFENRIKAAPTLFSFAKVPEFIKTFEHPKNEQWWESDRLLGTAKKDIPIWQFDQMCSRLGPSKKVNVIMIGFGEQSQSMAQWQQAAWVGGKKNDLVLCYGNGWATVFGWSESELVKRNLETLMLTEKVNVEILPKIESAISDGYQKKDWHKFDYITLEPPAWSYWTFAVVLIGSQLGFWFWARTNDFRKPQLSVN